MNEVKPGGVILVDYDVPSNSFPRNTINPDQIKKLISEFEAVKNGIISEERIEISYQQILELKTKFGIRP